MALDGDLAWTVDLGAEYPQKRSIVLGVALIAGAAGMMLPTAPLTFALTGIGLVLISNAELFLKQTYRVGEQGVERRCGLSVTAMEWPAVKRVEVDLETMKCSPFAKTHRLDAFRGVVVRFAHNRDEVLAKLHDHWDGKPVFLGRGTDGGEGRRVDEADRTRDHEASP